MNRFSGGVPLFIALPAPGEGTLHAPPFQGGAEVGELIVGIEGPGIDALRPLGFRPGEDGGDLRRVGRRALAERAGDGVVVERLGRVGGDGRSGRGCRLRIGGREVRSGDGGCGGGCALPALALPALLGRLGVELLEQAEPLGQPAHGGGIAGGDQPFDLLRHLGAQRGEPEIRFAVQRLPLPPDAMAERLRPVIGPPQRRAAAAHGAGDLHEGGPARQHAGGHDPLFLVEARTGDEGAFGRDRRLLGPAREAVGGVAGGGQAVGHGASPGSGGLAVLFQQNGRNFIGKKTYY